MLGIMGEANPWASLNLSPVVPKLMLCKSQL